MKSLFFSTFFIFAFAVTAFAQAENTQTQIKQFPTEFKSDGCSFFPDGDYRDCCVSHDLDYFYGGTWMDRWRSDKKLSECVKKKGGFKNKLISQMMWVGIRLGGIPLLPTPFRWGFGKIKPKDEKKLILFK